MNENDNKNRVYEFFKKNILTEKAVIHLLISAICILSVYIVGMRLIDSFQQTELPTVVENNISENNTTEILSDVTLMININTDNIFELCQLSGIGEAKARAILEYRKENGDFNSCDELLKIPGIGEKIYEKIKPFIYVE